jgi:hypothetical protein
MVGGEDMDKKYLVYKTTNLVNGNIYIGVHETYNINDRYLGSGKIIKQAIKKYGKHNFTKEILKIFKTRGEAFEYERALVDAEFITRSDVYNITEGGEGVKTHSPAGLMSIRESRIGKVMARDLTTGCVVKITKDEFYKHPERYVGQTSGKRVARDGDTVVVVDQLTEGLVGNTKGHTKARTAEGQIILVPVTDERLKTGELVAFNKGKVVVKDAEGNRFTVDKDDPRYISGELVGIRKGRKQPRGPLPTIKCPYCVVEGQPSNMKRWHFDNCKNKVKI